jgi:hypothetical protein
MNTKQQEILRKTGECAMASIVEMVAGLYRESAARMYVDSLGADEINALISKHEVDADPGETIDELKDRLVDAITDESIEPDGFEFDEESARELIQDDPLEITIRSGWESLGTTAFTPEEFCILLGTGGPATRIIGELDRGEPCNPKLQVQDWGTPWVDYTSSEDEDAALQKYCETFYFGE